MCLHKKYSKLRQFFHFRGKGKSPIKGFKIFKINDKNDTLMSAVFCVEATPGQNTSSPILESIVTIGKRCTYPVGFHIYETEEDAKQSIFYYPAHILSVIVPVYCDPKDIICYGKEIMTSMGVKKQKVVVAKKMFIYPKDYQNTIDNYKEK